MLMSEKMTEELSWESPSRAAGIQMFGGWEIHSFFFIKHRFSEGYTDISVVLLVFNGFAWGFHNHTSSHRLVKESLDSKGNERDHAYQ